MSGNDISLMTNATGLLAQVMPVLVGLLTAGALVKMVAKSVPLAETPRNTLMRAAGFAVSFSLISIGAFVALTLVIVNMAAIKSQQEFQTLMQDISRDMERSAPSR
jgi:hypothetical protein